MKNKIEKIQMAISLLTQEDVVIEKKNSCKRWLDKNDIFIAGYRLPNRKGGASDGGVFIIFASDEEDEIYCKIANGVAKEITPDISDELCMLLKGLV